jgi:hypothetical protein
MDEISILENMVESGDENIQNGIPSLDLPIHDMSGQGDLGDLALLKAALDGEGEMVVDVAKAGEVPLEDNTESTPGFVAQFDSDIDMPGGETLQVAPAMQLEVAIPEVSAEKRIEYSAVYSSVIEQITSVSDFGQDEAQYDVEFTDGRVDSVRHLSNFVHPHISSFSLESPQSCGPLNRDTPLLATHISPAFH